MQIADNNGLTSHTPPANTPIARRAGNAGGKMPYQRSSRYGTMYMLNAAGTAGRNS